MKISLFILGFLLSSPTPAASLIERWLQSLGALKAPMVETTACCDTEEKQLLNQCVRDLCGDSQKVDTIFITNRSFEENFRDPKREQEFEEYRPKLQEYAAKTRQRSQFLVEIIEAKLTANPKLFDVTQFKQEDLNQFGNGFLNQEAQVVSKPDEEDVAIDFPEEFSKEYPELTRQYAEYKRIYILGSEFTKISHGVYSIERAKSIILKDADGIEPAFKAFERFPATAEKVKTIKGKLQEQKEKLAQAESTPMETWDYTNILYALSSIKYELDALKWELPEERRNQVQLTHLKYPADTYNCERSAGCDKLIEKRLADFKPQEILSKATEKLNDNKKLDEIIQSCRYNWYSDQFARSEEQDIEAFRQQLEEIQARVLEHGLGFFSEHSKQNFKKMISELKHKLPEPRNSEETPELDEFKSNLEQLAQNPDHDPTRERSLHTLYNDLERLEHPFDFLEMGCHNQVATASDYYAAQDDPENHINVSSFSCDHPHHGKRIYAHEIGHAVSDWMRLKKFSSHSHEKYGTLRSCVQSNYSDNNPPFFPRGHPGDKEKTEEDMADVIAHLTFASVDSPLLFCALIEPHENGTDYLPDSINSSKKGPHSASIVRLLHEALFRGLSLSSSCEKLLSDNKDYLPLKKCAP